MGTEKQSYHHGDLRRALLDASLDLLEKNGMEGLSLRRAAASAGVSHAAPAHYFPSLKALLTALAVIGFERLTASMITARQHAKDQIGEQIQAAGKGYVEFAIHHPGLFRLMFSCTLLGWEDPALKAAASGSFAELEDIATAAADQFGVAEGESRTELIKLLWSVTHGYAHLYIDGQMQWLDKDNPGAAPVPPDISTFLFGMGMGKSMDLKKC